MPRHLAPIAMLSLAGASALLTAGCVARGRGYASPPPVAVVGPDDYVYYPGDEIYYDNTRHLYIYQDHGNWIRRPAPPQFWHREGPSVPMNFHDEPERHHQDVTRRYPRSWRPPASTGGGHGDEGHHGDSDRGSSHADATGGNDSHHDSDRDHHDH